MPKLSQTQKVIRFLQENTPQRFTARQIAEALAAQYPDDYRNKKAAFANKKEFISQVAAEIGSQKNSIIKACPDIVMQDKPRPRLYGYQAGSALAADSETAADSDAASLSERDLYPKLMQFLSFI